MLVHKLPNVVSLRSISILFTVQRCVREFSRGGNYITCIIDFIQPSFLLSYVVPALIFTPYFMCMNGNRSTEYTIIFRNSRWINYFQRFKYAFLFLIPSNGNTFLLYIIFLIFLNQNGIYCIRLYISLYKISKQKVKC